MSLGSNIYRLRTGRGLSQGDLAESLQVSRQSISKWETDGATPDLDKLLALSDLFGVTLDALVRGEVLENEAASPAVKRNDQALSAEIPAAAQPASGESSVLKIVVIVILVILALWLLFSLFMSPSLWPGLLVLIVIGGLGFALWTRTKETPEDQKKHAPDKRKLLIILLIAGILLLPVLGLASSLPAGPVYAKAGKESTLSPQEYPGMRFADYSAQQNYVSYTLVNETGVTMSYDASEQRIEVKKKGKWYQLKKRTDSKSNFNSMGILRDGKFVHIRISCEELYSNLGAGEYRVLLQVYPLSDYQNKQWIAKEFTIQAAFQLP